MGLNKKEEELIKLIEEILLKIRNGQQPEMNKIELKREWPDLTKKNKIGVSKFLKELVAIANTFGPKGYLIIGISENGELVDSPITSS